MLPIEVEFLHKGELVFNPKIIEYVRKIQETAAFLKAKMHTHPETAIILGTGLGSLVHEITDKYEINYSEIPNFRFQPSKDTAGN